MIKFWGLKLGTLLFWHTLISDATKGPFYLLTTFLMYGCPIQKWFASLILPWQNFHRKTWRNMTRKRPDEERCWRDEKKGSVLKLKAEENWENKKTDQIVFKKKFKFHSSNPFRKTRRKLPVESLVFCSPFLKKWASKTLFHLLRL